MSVNNGPLASNLIHVIGLKKTRDDGSTIISDTITIGREGSTTNIDSLVTRNIGFGPSNTLSIAGNVNVSMGNPVTALFSSFTPSSLVVNDPRIAYGAGKFIIIGDPGKVFYSTNGTTWTQVTNISFPSTALRNVIYAKDRFVAISEDLPVKVYTSTDGVTWNSFTPTGTISRVYASSYGNNFLVGVNPYGSEGIASITSTPEWTTGWSTVTFTGQTLYGTGFGTMSTATHGTNVFLIVGKNNFIRRNQGSPAVSGDWNLTIPTLPSISADWVYVGFGNDTFILTTNSATSLLTISRDAGKTWSTPIGFGITFKQIIYVEGVWYIASQEGFMMISKDNGVTWEKRTTGINSFYLAYGNDLFVSTSTDASPNLINLINFKKKRDDGSLITSDSITIGREGTMTTIKGVIEVPYSKSITENGLTFRMTQSYVNSGKDLLTLQGTLTLDTIEDPYIGNGKNLVANFTNNFNSLGMPTGPVDGVYTFSTDGSFGSFGLLNTNFRLSKGFTYKFIFTARADTDNTSINLYYDGANNSYFANISKTEYKTYTGYFISSTSGSAMISVSGIGNVRRTIKYTFFSIEPLYGATLNHSMYVDGGMIVKSGDVGIGGYVGIGTTTPKFPLLIESWIKLENNALSGFVRPAVGDTSSGGYGLRAYHYNNTSEISTIGTTGTMGGADSGQIQTISVLSKGSVVTFGAFMAVSDRRIKSNIVDIDDDRALRDLRLLKPKTYTYTDVVQKGSTPVYGFIAQEVKEVLNYASSYITETVPNVYELATFSGDTLTLTFNTADLSRDPSGTLFPRLKLKTREEKDEFVSILEILDAHTLRVDKDLTDWGGELVGDQIVPGNRIFVYGQEVNDFHTLTKDAIWTVATAALQEVDRQLQAEKQKTATMQIALDALLERVNALEQKTSV